jgi:hypothetical protein
MTAPAIARPYMRVCAPREQVDSLLGFQRILCGAAIVSGFFAFWATRYTMYSDGISYLDIAGLYAHGAWKSAVNEYWSPMLSWLIAAALYVIHPAARFEPVLFHAICLAGYLAALLAFRYFLRQLIRVVDPLYPPFPGQVTLRRALLTIAYAAFIWATLPLIGLCTPDVLVAGLVFVISAMLLRSAWRPVGLGFCAAFGGLLGLCWLTKAALLPIGLATLPAFAALVRKWRKPLAPLLCTVAALAAVCLPFLAAIRIAQGHWTFGKAGVLNYSWEVNGVTRYFHWQGGPEEFGRPVHPTRQLTGSPPVYEFSTSWPVTYSPWFDPPYWYEGSRVSLNAKRQILALGANSAIALLLLLAAPGLLPVIFVWFFKQDTVPRPAWWKMTAGVWVWCGVTILLYSLVFVEPRYIESTVAVMCCLLLAPALSQPAPILVRRIRWFTAAAVFPCLYACWRPVFLGFAFLLFNITGMQPYPNAYWREAQYMQDIGMRPDDAVGVIGTGVHAYWARLVRAKIVAEIPVRHNKRFNLSHSPVLEFTDVNTFWSESPESRRQVLKVFATAGVRWVVAEPVPSWVKAGEGWTELPFTRQGGAECGCVVRTFVRRLNQ